MFFAVDTQTQLFLFTSVILGSFFLGNAMDGVLGDDGFGTFGNMIVVGAGFFVGLWVGKHYGYSVSTFKIGVVAGLVGSFVCLLVLSILKAILNRL
jgi:uncharacterized membrane protein YeaQ/YmgE (transglycosylase-associated protein family)